MFCVLQDIRECVDTEELEQFNTRAREKLNSLRTKIEDLERIGREQDREEDKNVILKNVENHRQRLTSNITSLRKTNLAVKLAIDKRMKEELISGGTVRKRTINNKATLARAASSVTESLLELNQTMDSQVKKGNSTLSTLVGSSNMIDETHEEFKSMGGHIQNSEKLMRKYNRREMTDKLLIVVAILFFLATVVYILKRRLWPG